MTRIETVIEAYERAARENEERRMLAARPRKVPGRTLPEGAQWTGLDQPGCGAAKRRLRQAAKKEGR